MKNDLKQPTDTYFPIDRSFISDKMRIRIVQHPDCKLNEVKVFITDLETLISIVEIMRINNA